MKNIWKYISIFLTGVIVGFLVLIRVKKPDIVEGDYISNQKVKDNSKHKLSRKERRYQRKLMKQLRKSE